MKRTVTITFKDGNKMTVEPKADCFGLFYLDNGMAFSVNGGTLYKKKGNVICGEDITNEVDTIEVSMQY